MRFLYTAVGYLLLPWLPIRLWWRGRKEQGYRQNIAERFGHYSFTLQQPLIWIHAVSVGETRAAQPLIERLRECYPHSVLLTHMTATGRATGKQLFGTSVAQVYLPYDFPFAVRRFIDHFKPQIGLVMETELWPNLLATLHQRAIPILLVNARLSERSYRRYARWSKLTREMLQNLAAIAAQSKADAERLQQLGATRITVSGNLKFDLTVPTSVAMKGMELRRLFGTARPVWVAGSTREGEEILLLDAITKHSLPPGTLTVIVPRHPQRFAEVVTLIRQRGFTCSLRSENQPIAQDTCFVLGDSMGEMLAYYSAADVVLIGGSLGEFGSQNLIEACAVGKPVVIGPSIFNFTQAVQDAVAEQAAIQVGNAQQAVEAVAMLLADPLRCKTMSEAALSFAHKHRGAADRIMALLTQHLPSYIVL